MLKFSVKLKVNGVLNGGDKASFKSGMKKLGATAVTVYDNLLPPQCLFSEKGMIPIITRDCFLGFSHEVSLSDTNFKDLTTMQSLSPNSLLRGYLYAGVGLKKQGAIRLPALTGPEINAELVSVLFRTKRGEKDSISVRNEVAFPECEYSATGFVDLQELLFVSVDGLYDRKALDKNYLESENVKAYFKQTYGVNLPEVKWYVKGNSLNEISEEGVVLPPEVAKKCLESFFGKVLNASYSKSKAVGQLTELNVYFNNKTFNLLNKEELNVLLEEAKDLYVNKTYRQVEPRDPKFDPTVKKSEKEDKKGKGKTKKSEVE